MTTSPSQFLRADSVEGMPSPGLRSVITYLLFVHFFFLAVGIKSRTDSSGLEQDLRNKVPGLRPYLQFLGMDLSYMFHLTYYDPTPTAPHTDTDYFLEVDVPQPDGTMKLLVLPSQEESAGLRFRRLERLIHLAGMEGENQNETAAVLAQGIARRLIMENNCVAQAQNTPLKLRFRRRVLQNLMQPPAELERSGVLKVEPDDPSNFETVYEVLAVVTPELDVQVSRVGAASNAAAPGQEAPAEGAKP